MVRAVAVLSASKQPCPNTGQTLSSLHNLSPGALPDPLHLQQPARGRGHGASAASLLSPFAPHLGQGSYNNKPCGGPAGPGGEKQKPRLTLWAQGAQLVGISLPLLTQPKEDTWTVACGHPSATKVTVSHSLEPLGQACSDN